MKRALVTGIILFFAAALGVSAQNAGSQPTAVLQYFDNASQITVTDGSGKPVKNIYYGMPLGPGFTIKTGSSTAEIQLSPNGSIFKLADDTNFSVQSFEGDNNQTVNAFSLLAGRLRTIAAHAKSAVDRYSIQTPTAVCGVRGTDFTLDVVPGKTDAVGVLSGVVNFVDTQTGASIDVRAGDYANTYASVFKAVALSSAEKTQLFRQMTFAKLKPSAVPGHSGEATKALAAASPTQSTPASQPVVPEQPQPRPEQASVVHHRRSNPVLGFLRSNLDMQVGTITIDGTTYSKAVLEPTFTIGKLRAALYLPVIYQSNIFDPTTWYHPGGNNEWNFGTGSQYAHATALERAKDVARDLVSKIRYLEWGNQRDPFFFKVGNLSDMTIGQGLLMYNYANNQDFPAIRRVGLELGVDFGAIGFESVVNDLANPQVFGGRVYIRPLGKGSLKPSIGLSAVTDISPAADLVSSGASKLYGNPIFIALGPGVNVPIVDTSAFSLSAFANAGGMIPYFRNSFSDGTTTIPAGLYTKALFTTNGGTVSLRNYGFASGLSGSLFGLDWRLAYRNFNGIFQPSMFNSTYNRMRGQYVVDMGNYVLDPSNPVYQHATMGIYGRAGLAIGRHFDLNAGYFWPWSSPTNPGALTNDYFHLKLLAKRGIIPNFGISGSLSYDRTDFVPTLLKETSAKGLSLFDANTTVKAELDYPVASSLDLALVYTTAVVHNPQTGNVEMDPNDPNLPLVKGSVSIETRVHF